MKSISKVSCILFGIGLAQFGLLSGQNIPVPASVIRVVEGKVNFNAARGGGFSVIDGKLDDGCWEKASRISGFNGIEGRRREVDQQTQVYLIFNDQEAWHGKGAIRLYLGVKCHQSHMDKLERIGGYYRDAFYPNREALNQSRAEKEAYFTLGGEEKFPHWEYQHSFSNDYWSEERACYIGEIMGKELVEGEKIVGDSVKLHLSRRNGIHNENSGWNGTLVFGEATDPVCEISTFGELSMGENAVDFEVINNNVSPVALKATVKIFPLSGVQYSYELYSLIKLDSLKLSGIPYTFPNQINLPGREVKKAKAPYTVREEGEHYITFTLSDPENETIYYRTGFLFTVAPNKKRLTDMRTRLDSLQESIPGSPEDVMTGLKKAFGILDKAHRSLEKEAAVTPTQGSWNRLTEDVNNLDKKIGKFGHKIESYKVFTQPQIPDLTGSWEKLEYGLGIEGNLVKLRRDKPFPGEIKDSVRISACGNEYEGFQLVILPFEKDLSNISVKATDLINREKGTRIHSSNIEINAVDYVYTKRPTYEVKYVGWWPDPLVPLEEPYFNDVNADHLLQPVWVSVYVPSNTQPGNYEGEITVSASNSHPLKVNFVVNVRNFNISDTPHIKEFFRLGGWNAFYGKKMSPEMFREWSAFQLKYRIGQPSQSFGKVRNPDGTYDYSVADTNIEFCIEKGMNVFDLGFPSIRNLTPEGIQEAMDYLVDNSIHLKEKGLFEYALVEPLNEVSADVTKPFYTKIKEAVPELQILQKGGGSNYYDYWLKGEKPPLEGVLDIWCPDYVPPPSWDPAIKERHEAGEKCWAYHDYIDCVIDKPAINLRTIHWRAWTRKLDGLAYWSTTFWPYNVRRGEPVKDKWPYSPWEPMSHPMGNGDGYFIYPGPDELPLSSFRLENLRDAQEDYEYLYTLRSLTDKLKSTEEERFRDLINESEKLLDVDNVLPEPASPEMLYQLRDRIAIQIEKIKTLFN